MEPIKEATELTFHLPPIWEGMTAERYYECASRWTEKNYRELLHWVRSLSDIEVTKEYFWREYIWCSLVSGFNARVVTKFYDRFLDVVGHDPCQANYNVDQIRTVFANTNKINGILKCAKLIKSLGWSKFYEAYIAPKNIKLLQALPNIGPVISHHLARNLGVDTIKPDLHLVRLANHFGYDTPFDMCQHLADVYQVKLLGEVDLKLFLYSQAYGTVHLK